jgi:phosphopantetheine--protein transferase-like protein
MDHNKRVSTSNTGFNVATSSILSLQVAETNKLRDFPQIAFEQLNKENIVDSVFYIDLSTPPLGNLSTYYYLLSDEEQEKARRFIQIAHQQRFAWGKVVLRKLLSMTIGVEPELIVFEKGKYSKPYLNAKNHAQNIHFSVSYSGNALVLVLDQEPIGIDLEGIQTAFDVESMQEAVCSTSEIQYLNSLVEEQQKQAFFTLWTRKEALLKWSGKGIGLHLSQCTLLEGESEIEGEIVGAPTHAKIRVDSFLYEKENQLLSIAQSFSSKPKQPYRLLI